MSSTGCGLEFGVRCMNWTTRMGLKDNVERLKQHGNESLQRGVATEAVKMEKLHTRQFLLFHKFGIRLSVHRKFGTFGCIWLML